MASIPSTNQFPCKSLHKSYLNCKATPKIAHFLVNLNFSALSVNNSTKPKQNFTVRALSDDEWGPDKEPAAPRVAVLKEPTEIEILKKQLVDSFYGTNRGLSATSETRAEIVELITQLEAKNPTPAPTEALNLLNGKWILAYVRNSVAITALSEF